MVVIDDLDERLDFRSLGYSLLGHGSCDFERVSLDSGYDCVREGMCFVAGIDRDDDDDLLAGESSSSDERYLAWLDELHLDCFLGSSDKKMLNCSTRSRRFVGIA